MDSPKMRNDLLCTYYCQIVIFSNFAFDHPCFRFLPILALKTFFYGLLEREGKEEKN